MATVSLLDIIKAWPQKTTAVTPKKTPEVFIPSNISEAPKKWISFIEALKQSSPLAVADKSWFLKIAKETTPITNLASSWRKLEQVWTTFKEAKPTDNKLTSIWLSNAKNFAWPIFETVWQRIQRPEQTKKDISEVLTKVWEWKIDPLWAAWEIWIKLWWEALWLIPQVALTDLAITYWLNATNTKKAYEWFMSVWQDKITEAIQKWLNISPEKAKNYSNIWVWLLNFWLWAKWWAIQWKWWVWNIIKWWVIQESPNLALVTIWLASQWEWKPMDYLKWFWGSAISGILWLWVIWTNKWLQQKLWEKIWDFAEKQWLVSTLMSKDNKKTLQDIIPDNDKTKLSQVELDKQKLSEVLSKNKEETNPKQTLQQVIESKIKQPVKSTAEEKVITMENQQVRQSIKDVLLNKKNTDGNNVILEKINLLEDFWKPDFYNKLNSSKLTVKQRIELLDELKDVNKKNTLIDKWSELLLKNDPLNNFNRVSDLEKLKWQEIFSKQPNWEEKINKWEIIDPISLPEDIWLLHLERNNLINNRVDWLLDKDSEKRLKDLEKEIIQKQKEYIQKDWEVETWDIFATPEERAAKVEKDNVLKNTNKLITETKLTWDTKIKLAQEMVDSLKKWDTSNILYKDILEQNQWVDFKVWDEITVKNTKQIKDYLKKNKIENTSESYDLELVPWTFELITRNINLDTFLNNIIIKKWKDLASSWNTYVQWLKSLWKQVANQLYKDFWLGNIFDKSNFSKYKTSINDSFKNLEKNIDNALIGWKTANEEIPITNDNYKQVKQTFFDWAKLDFRDTFWTIDWPLITKYYQLDYWRKLHKWNQEIIDKYIPKELQEIMTKVEDSNARLLYDTTWEKMVWDWLLDSRSLAENYSKFLLIPESRKRFETDVTWWKSLFTTSDWMQFDSLAEMQTYIKRSKDLYWRELTPEFDVWKLSSLTKEKTTWDIDLYRFNSPSAQLFAYMRDVWDVYKTDSVFQFFNKVDKSKNKEVSNLKDTLFNSSIFQNAIEQVLNLEKKSKWYWWLAKTWVQKITKWSLIAALWGNIWNLWQAVTYWTTRNVVTWWNLNIFRRLDNNSKNVLRKWWITQAFEITSVKDIWTNKSISFFTGTPTENINKTWAAIPIIKSHLKMNWYDISKMDNNQLFQAFDDFMINWDQKLKLQAKDDIYRATNYIWNTTSTSRNSIWILNDLWFTSLKTFQTDSIWQSYQQIRNTFLGWTRENRLKSWWKFIAPKLVKHWLKVVIAAQIYQKAQEYWEEITEELSEFIADNITTQMVWDDITNLKSALIWVLSNAWNIAPWILKDFIEAVNIAYKWEWKTWVQYAINSLLNKTAAWRNINAITKIATWKELKESLSEILKTPSFIWQNSKWVATWNQIDSKFEAAMEILKYGWDTPTRNYLYEQIDKAKTNVENPEMSETWKIALRYAQNIYKQMWRDLENLYFNTASYNNIWEYTDWVIDKQYTVNTLKEVEWSKTLDQLLTKLWITTQVSNDILQATWKSAETIISENDKVEKIINQYFSTNEIPVNLTLDEKLKFMQENNPVLFNKFISWLVRTKRYLNENEDIDITNKQHIDKITEFFSTSTNQIDAAISDYTDTKSITTDIAEKLSNDVMDLKANIWKVDWLNKAKAQLQEIENTLKMFKDNWLVTSWMVDSLSLKAFEMAKNIWELEDKWYSTFIKDFPVISEYVKKWLYLRWEKDFIDTNIKPNIWKQQTTENNWTTATSGDDLKKTILNTATWYQDKKKKTELPLLKVEKKQIQPLFNPTARQTLAEILLKK